MVADPGGVYPDPDPTLFLPNDTHLIAFSFDTVLSLWLIKPARKV